MSLSMKQLWLALGVSMLLPAAHGTVYDRGDAMWRAAPLEMRWQAELSRNDSRAEMVRAWHAAIDDSVAVMTVSQRGTPPLSFHAVNAYSGLYQTEHAGWLDIANIAVDGLVMRGSSATGCCSRLSAQRSWIVATGLDPAAMQRLFATAGVAAHPYLLMLDNGQLQILSPAAGSSPNVVVPLPAALLLMGSALAGLTAIGRRRWRPLG